jgi:hypothetical protein
MERSVSNRNALVGDAAPPRNLKQLLPPVEINVHHLGLHRQVLDVVAGRQDCLDCLLDSRFDDWRELGSDRLLNEDLGSLPAAFFPLCLGDAKEIIVLVQRRLPVKSIVGRPGTSELNVDGLGYLVAHVPGVAGGPNLKLASKEDAGSILFSTVDKETGGARLDAVTV